MYHPQGTKTTVSSLSVHNKKDCIKLILAEKKEDGIDEEMSTVVKIGSRNQPDLDLMGKQLDLFVKMSYRN